MSNSTKILPDYYGRDVGQLNNILKMLLVAVYVIPNCFSCVVVPKNFLTRLWVCTYKGKLTFLFQCEGLKRLWAMLLA